MKNMILILALIAFGPFAQATFYFSSQDVKDYSFKYSFKRSPDSAPITYEISEKAPSFDEAYEKAAMKCYQHFKAKESRLTQNIGEEIINACANPVST